MKSNTARAERLIKGASRGPARPGEAGFDRGLYSGVTADAKRRRCYPCNYRGQMDGDNDDDATARPQTEAESN